MKTGKEPGPLEISLELIAASGVVGIQVMAEICQTVLDGFGMSVEYAVGIVVAVYKRNGDIGHCSCHRSMKLIEHGKVVESVVGKRLCRVVTVSDMQFGFMLEKGTTDSVFILR